MNRTDTTCPSPDCDCQWCDDDYRQGRRLASVEASAKRFVVAFLGLVVVALLAVAQACGLIGGAS